MNPKILPNYIRTQLRQGVPKERLLETLRVGGWNQTDVEVAFKEVDHEPKNTPSFDLGSIAHRGPIHILRRILWALLFIVILFLAFLYYLGGEGVEVPFRDQPVVDSSTL